ncbi:hypothetical protein CL176_04275 [Suicoccus acidiformans]|uniref:Mga helix-turn-helix domain-containing protein n=1 Tax=Suicoccus acidiformans TaxID=2036206 RepID=A0A347WJL7_9LACT|nr:M protein trans-acting positive regulator PRD domain-containing protein [Suicoccus acidiformans]AXY25274.1 hypothetical protein CL176_04275 [Suicoccus acidiformans]
MRQVLQASQLRRLEFIEILYSRHGGWVSLPKVAEYLKTTPLNLKNDIFGLRKLGVTIITKRAKVRLDTTNSPTIETIYRDFNRHSPALNLVEEIFNTPDHTTESLSEALFISPSTVYRHINTLNKRTEEVFNVKVDKRPYRFGGDERDIRYFLAEYFAERYPLEEWPFKEVDERVLETFIQYFTRELNIGMNFSYYYFVKILTAISLIRTIQGFFIETDNSHIEPVYNVIKDQHTFKEMKKYIREHYDRELDIDFIGQMFISFLSPNYFFTIDSFYLETRLNDQINSSITYLDWMISRLMRDFDLELDNKQELIYELHNTNVLNKADLNVTPILYDQKGGFVREFSAKYPEFYEAAFKAMQGYRNHMLEKPDYYMERHLTYTLIVQWRYLICQLANRAEKINVLILTKYDEGYSRLIKDMMEFRGTQQMNIDIYDEIHFDRDTIAQSNYDILVSNFEIEPIEGKHISYNPSLFSVESLYELYQIVIKIIDERKKNDYLSKLIPDKEDDEHCDESDDDELDEIFEEA